MRPGPEGASAAGATGTILGGLADRAGIGVVYQLCAFLPALGLLTALLPAIERPTNR